MDNNFILILFIFLNFFSFISGISIGFIISFYMKNSKDKPYIIEKEKKVEKPSDVFKSFPKNMTSDFEQDTNIKDIRFKKDINLAYENIALESNFNCPETQITKRENIDEKVQLLKGER